MKSQKKEKLQEEYNQLASYTLTHKNPDFIHQHIVDAYTAQTADDNTKPITMTFALAGLYLYVEKNFTGKQVQQMHMRMAKMKGTWNTFRLPKLNSSINVAHVSATPEGRQRDEMIRKWCVSVWQTFSESHKKVEEIVGPYLT